VTTSPTVGPVRCTLSSVSAAPTSVPHVPPVLRGRYGRRADLAGWAKFGLLGWNDETMGIVLAENPTWTLTDLAALVASFTWLTRPALSWTDTISTARLDPESIHDVLATTARSFQQVRDAYASGNPLAYAAFRLRGQDHDFAAWEASAIPAVNDSRPARIRRLGFGPVVAHRLAAIPQMTIPVLRAATSIPDVSGIELLAVNTAGLRISDYLKVRYRLDHAAAVAAAVDARNWWPVKIAGQRRSLREAFGDRLTDALLTGA
jgi:hypothetical protein